MTAWGIQAGTTIVGLNRRRRSGGNAVSLEPLEDRRMLAAFAEGEILVQFAAEASVVMRAQARSAVQGRALEVIQTKAMAQQALGTLERVSLGKGMTVERAIAAIAKRPGVVFAEPNWKLSTTAVSNDPYYTTSGRLWGTYGDDLPAASGGAGTTNQFGSQAEKAWDAGFVGSTSVVVGIVDEGIDVNHPDLKANIWVNPFDPLDGIDNDGNGYVDDVNGWDFYSNDNTVYDGTGDDHGTHVAGTVGGVGGNGIGVAGVSWNVTMISTKFLGADGGSTSGAIKAIDYLTDLKMRHGVNIVASNNSWGGGYGSYSGTSMATPLTFTVTLAAAATSTVTVNYATANGTAVAGSDFTAASGTLTFAPGETSKAVAVDVIGDTAVESNESFTLVLSGASANARITTFSATGTITNDDQQVARTLSIASVRAPESQGIFSFVVTLSAASTSRVTVKFATANGTAKAGRTGDYTAASGTLTFNAGETSKVISVSVRNDTLVEADETFSVRLSSASGATIATGTGTGTIVNDDGLTTLRQAAFVALAQGEPGTGASPRSTRR